MSKKIYAKNEDGNRRYQYNENTGSVSRAPVGLIDPPPTRVGEASNLSDAISIVREHESDNGRNIQEVKIK